MKSGKIVLALLALIVLGGGYYVYQGKKQDKALTTHNVKKFEQIREAAKKSGSAGLLVMTTTLNKYKTMTGNYPAKLIDLYPKFIPDKAFLTTMGWQYEKSKGSYLIKRDLKERNMYYAMGPDMKLKTGRMGEVSITAKVASAPVKKTPDRTKQPAKQSAAPVLAAVNLKQPVKTTPDLAALRQPEMPKPIKAKPLSPVKPAFNLIKTDLTDKEQYLLSFNNTSLYIWKTSEGIIGFSNTHYPKGHKFSVYQGQQWVEYRPIKKKN